jgi:hypothetical protein
MIPEYPDLQLRLEKLEKQNRTFRCAAIALLVLVGAILLMGQAAPKQRVIEAEKFVLTDAAGKTRAVFGINERGDPMLVLNALHGDSSLGLSMDKDRPRIFLAGEEGAPYAVLGPGSIAIQDDTTGKAASMSVYVNPSSAGFSLKDGTAIPAVFALLPSGMPTLDLCDKGGTGSKCATLSYSEDGPSLELEDAQGYTAILGSGGLVTPKTGETHKTSAASLVLSDKDKNVIWKAP